jgi:sirohydrochlorin ferrochelatase
MAIADKICMVLSIHAQIEEEIFYPPVREATSDDDMMDEADFEHAGAKNLIAQIASMEAGESHFNAKVKVKVLGEMIDHHVGEERDEMFPQARATGIDLVSLKQQLAARRAELEQEHNATA